MKYIKVNSHDIEGCTFPLPDVIPEITDLDAPQNFERLPTEYMMSYIYNA